MLDRRTFLLRAGAAAALLALLDGQPGAHAEASAGESAEFKAALQALIGKASPRDTGLTLELPEAIENGDYVPVALGVDSPMTAENHVKAIHILSTANPRATVATFRFTFCRARRASRAACALPRRRTSSRSPTERRQHPAHAAQGRRQGRRLRDLRSLSQ